MTLRQKITWQVGTTLVGLVLVSGDARWGINALHQDYGVALEGYQRLRQAYVAGSHLQTAQILLRWPHPQALTAAQAEVRAAITNFTAAGEQAERIPRAVGPDDVAAPANVVAIPQSGWDAAAAAEVHAALQDIADNLQLLQQSPQGLPPDAVQTQRDAVIAQLGRISDLSSGIRRATEAAQGAAAERRRTTFALVGGLCGAVVLLAVIFGMLHYRGVMNPIRRLTAGVHGLTRGHFKGRIDARGRDELASLAGDFNRMAEELDGFYHQLERKVAEKSKELIRSERLASVGYLAAGVAHEINNPLSIISGYAEYSLAELKKQQASTDNGEVGKSLVVIRDEAFRCKQTTQKLLSLARGGDDARQPVNLLKTARDVVSIIGGLQEHRQKRIVVQAAHSARDERGVVVEPIVLAVEQEMKQVVLNLAVNALEAVAPDTGEVRIEVTSANGQVELTVTDNGRGMTAETVDRVFEPFFTQKRGVSPGEAPSQGAEPRHGTGLGLSITHAIVQSHGGAMIAQSAGVGRGSRFIVRLPAH